jgi:tripartite-type tricarboxylate transporter receptor subunit TctC
LTIFTLVEGAKEMTERSSVGLLALVLGLTLALAPRAVAADTGYPTRPVRLVIPFSAGGSLDLLARVLAQAVGAQWHQRVLIENHPGADGELGAALVARAASDGYRLMATSQAIATNVSLHPARPYDAQKDLSPVMVIASTSSVLFASPSLHANSVADVIRAAKAQPGRLNYASQGLGTSGYWAIELFKLQAGLDIVHIPFNDYGQQTSALLQGDIAVATVTVPQAFGLIGTGRLMPLAVSGSTRSSALPDVPTMQEVGVRGYEAATWYGLYAAGGTPKEIIDTINAGFKAALESADVKARLVPLGIEPVGGTPEHLRDYLAQETVKWAKVMKASGIRP